ncbi:MAG: hypothetical protein L6Q83_00820 [Gammaproteobacteria bacterium]|nr:hypothetical protein [Gammaproteobacteria bacterium]
MKDKKDFNITQWRALRNAPQFVALATAAAGNSGLLGSLSEGMAAASAFSAAGRANNELIRQIFTRDEIRSAQQDIQAVLKSVPAGAAVESRLQEAALDAVRAALEALQAVDAGTDLDDYRKMLTWLGEEVANAAKEGDFLGFGGERVSEGERKFLARLYMIVGRP